MENSLEKKEEISKPLLILNILLVFCVITLVSAVASGPKNTKTVKNETATTEKKPDVFQNLKLEAKAVYVYDVAQNKVLFAKNELAQLPLASLTKLMTAFTALDLLPKNSEVTINREFLTAEGDSGLLAGESWELKDLLDFSLVVSSNDGARSVASVIGALNTKDNNYDIGRKDFILKMNTNAQKLGLNQTYFINESGLDETEKISGGYGSAKDVAEFLKYLLVNKPEIIEATKYNNQMFSSATKEHEAKNTNDIINKIPGLLASKTGYTDLAGGNLVVAFDVSIGRPVVAVVLGSTIDGRFSDMNSIVEAIQKYLTE